MYIINSNKPQGHINFRVEWVIRITRLPNDDLSMLLQDPSGQHLHLVVTLEALGQFGATVCEGVTQCVDPAKHRLDAKLRIHRRDED